MKIIDIAEIQRVQIRKRIADILNYVPPKGFDFTFEQVELDDKNPRSPKLYDCSIVTSASHPDYPKEARHVTELLAGWRNIVSDRVRKQNAEPLKHRIVTIVNREKIQGDKDTKEMIDALPSDKKWKDEESGNDLAEISGEVKER